MFISLRGTKIRKQLAFIYNLAIGIYGLVIKGASPYSNKAKQFVDGRRDLLQNIEEAIKSDPHYLSRKRYWFHSSSAGEFEQARPLIEEIRKRDSSAKIFITFFSPSGYNLQKNYKLADFVFYLPMDLPKNVNRFLDIVRPDFAVFIRSEFWYNFIRAIHKRSIPLYLVSSDFIPKQPFFKWWGGIFRDMLAYYTRIFVQDWGSEQLLAKINVRNVSVCGDTRFDRVAKVAADKRVIAPLEHFTQRGKSKREFLATVVAGSTFIQDEKVLLSILDRYRENGVCKVKMVIAPHEVGEKEITTLQTLFSEYNTILYSQYDGSNLSELQKRELEGAEIFIIDCVGILSAAYIYGDFAYVGGGFGIGVHNVLEPAAHGLPVLFGPNHKRFMEAVGLISAGGAFTISNPNGYMVGRVDIFDLLIHNPKYRKECSKRSLWYVNKNVGATNKIVDYFLKSNS